MYRQPLTCLVLLLLSSFTSYAREGSSEVKATFKENKGQLHDQFNQSRNDILYYGNTKGMSYYLKKDGISYQLYQASTDNSTPTTIQRIDINWIGANLSAPVKGEGAFPDVDNYYTSETPALNVKTFNTITYKNIYKQIDLKYYETEGTLKYDYIVHPGADYKQILLQINGADALLNEDGTVTIRTPLGNITEGQPKVYQDGGQIEAAWKVKEGTLSFEIGAYDKTKELIIDPMVREWGTLYGGGTTPGAGGIDFGMSTSTDASGNVFLYGTTNSANNIATAGAYQTTVPANNTFAFIVKFNAAGVRQWGTYYGSSGNTNAPSLPSNSSGRCVTDAAGNLYIIFSTTVVKFTPSGGASVLISGLTGVSVIALDATGNIYLAGSTASLSGVATTGAYQFTHGGGEDAILMKYNSAGVKLWGTYYGGAGTDDFNTISVAANGDILAAGILSSGTGLTTAGTYQPTFLGTTGSNGALIRFDNTGNRLWATYYGDGTTIINGCSEDAAGNIYISGQSGAVTGIATTGAWQTIYGGGATDVIIAKFDALGQRIWGTYYGGAGTDDNLGCTAAGGKVRLAGNTASTDMASPGALQYVCLGCSLTYPMHSYIAEFDDNGQRNWASYLGGAAVFGHGVWGSSDGSYYVCGHAFGGAGGLTTPGAHQTTSMGTFDAFLVKFTPCTTPSATITAAGPSTICAGSTVDLSVPALTGATYTWYKDDVVIIGSTTNNYSTSQTGSYKALVVDATGCPGISSPFAVTVNPNPSVSIAKSNVLCNGGSTGAITLTPSGGTAPYTYSWQSMGATTATITGLAAGTYISTTTDNNGCIKKDTITVTEPPALTATHAQTDVLCFGASTGVATVNVSGGTTPYSYLWNNSITTASNTTISAGLYTVVTTDNNGCTRNDTFNITQPADIIRTLTTTDNHCFSEDEGKAFILAAGGTAPYTYQWLSGSSVVSTADSATGLTAGTYVLQTIDANGCLKSDTFTINEPAEALATVCAVTVDSTTGKNMVIWEKGGIQNAMMYKVYRETFISGQYNLIGAKWSNEMSTYEDTSSVPLQQSYSYKISVVDSCGRESDLSDFHKTIHLTSNVGINNEVNLIWNAYEGKPYSTHYIMRSNNGGPFVNIAQVPSSSTSYSDLTPPSGQKDYRIDIDIATACNPTAKTSAYNYISSNVITLDPTGVEGMPGAENIRLYPNPSSGLVYIKGTTPAKIVVEDITGKVVTSTQGVNEVSLHQLANGAYIIKLFDSKNNRYYQQKIIKQ